MNAQHKDAGSDLTAIAEYSETAQGLAELQQKFKGLVIDVTTPKGLKEAKAATFELRTLRTTLEKKRKELKEPILERGKLLDSEAKRITEEIRQLEEPIDVQIKAEEARIESERLEKLEAERLRAEAIQQKIQAIRDVPASLVGKPSVIIAGQLAKLQATELDEAELAEHYVTATDARSAAIANVERLLAAQQEADAEKKRQAERDAEMEAMRKQQAEMQAKLDQAEADRVERERKAAAEEEARIAREAAEKRAAEIEAQRKIDEAARLEREAQEKAEREQQARLQAERDEAARIEREYEIEQRREAEEKLRVEQQRVAELERDAARAKKEAAAKAEAERLAGLGLREAAQAVVEFFRPSIGQYPVVCDLAAALNNDTAEAKPARTKRPEWMNEPMDRVP